MTGLLYNNGIVEGREVYTGWVWIEWLYPGQNKLRAIKGVRAIEREIKERGLRGWLMASERAHTVMHKIITTTKRVQNKEKGMGAFQYGEDENRLYFMKEVK